MQGSRRAATLLAAAVVVGLLVWFVPHFNRWTTGGYFGAMGTLLVAGAVLGLAQLPARERNPVATFFVVFVPVLVVAGWVVLGAQPHGDWFRSHVLSWSGDIGVRHAVRNLSEHVAVIAFAVGVVFGLAFEPALLSRRRGAAVLGATPPSAAVPEAVVIVASVEPDSEPVGPLASEEPTRVESAQLFPEAEPAEPLASEEPTRVESASSSPEPVVSEEPTQAAPAGTSPGAETAEPPASEEQTRVGAPPSPAAPSASEPAAGIGSPADSEPGLARSETDAPSPSGS